MREMVPVPRLAAAIWLRNARSSRSSGAARFADLPRPVPLPARARLRAGTYVATINGIPYKDFIAPGLIASAAMWSSAFETTYNVYFRMNELRLYDNVISTPAEPQDVVAGDLAWSASRATVYGVVVLIVVSAFGLVSSWWALLIPPFVALGGLCSVIGYTFTTLIPKIDLYSYFFTLGITPMFLFSGISSRSTSSRPGSRWLPGSCRSTTWSRSRADWRPGRSSWRSRSVPPGWRRSAHFCSWCRSGRCAGSWSLRKVPAGRVLGRLECRPCFVAGMAIETCAAALLAQPPPLPRRSSVAGRLGERRERPADPRAEGPEAAGGRRQDRRRRPGPGYAPASR